jgi:hypothetical protein
MALTSAGKGYILAAKYLVMVEFESLAMAQGSMAYVNVKPELLVVHGPKVLNNCIRVPSVRISKTMSKDHITGKSYRVLDDTIRRVNTHTSHSKSVSVTTPSRHTMAGAAVVPQACHPHDWSDSLVCHG